MHVLVPSTSGLIIETTQQQGSLSLCNEYYIQVSKHSNDVMMSM